MGRYPERKEPYHLDRSQRVLNRELLVTLAVNRANDCAHMEAKNLLSRCVVPTHESVLCTDNTTDPHQE